MPKFLRDIDLNNNNLLNPNNIYTKSQVDTSLSAKADQSTTYTKTQNDTSFALKVDKTTTVNGHALSGNVSVTASDISLGNLTNDSQVKRTEMGVASGVATLDGTGKLTSAQIPSAITGAIVYQGVWDASANTPILANGVGTKGQYYKVSVSGTTNIDGFNNWTAGDLIIFDGTTWDQVQGGNSDVVSVAGRIGTITLTTADVAASTNKNYVTDAQSTVVAATSGANTGDETLSTIKTKLGITTLSGSNTGDQTITLTGDVTGTGTGSFVTAIGANKVTLAQMATLAASSFIGNSTAGVATPTALTATQAKTLLAIAQADVSGLVTALTAKAAFTAQTFTGKQTFFTSTAGSASINITTGVDPTTPVSGDIWSTSNLLKFYNGTANKTIAYLDSNITGSAASAALATAVSGGVANQILWQTATGVTGFLTSVVSGVLVTNGSGVPSIATTLPAVNGASLTGLVGTQISGNISGSAANVTGTVAMSNGGTGATTAALARTALAATSKYAANIGNGVLTTITVSHNLGTQDVTVALYDTTSLAKVETDVTLVDANSVNLIFTVAPTTNQYRVVVIG